MLRGPSGQPGAERSPVDIPPQDMEQLEGTPSGAQPDAQAGAQPDAQDRQVGRGVAKGRMQDVRQRFPTPEEIAAIEEPFLAVGDYKGAQQAVKDYNDQLLREYELQQAQAKQITEENLRERALADEQ